MDLNHGRYQSSSASPAHHSSLRSESPNTRGHEGLKTPGAFLTPQTLEPISSPPKQERFCSASVLIWQPATAVAGSGVAGSRVYFYHNWGLSINVHVVSPCLVAALVCALEFFSADFCLAPFSHKWLICVGGCFQKKKLVNLLLSEVKGSYLQYVSFLCWFPEWFGCLGFLYVGRRTRKENIICGDLLGEGIPASFHFLQACFC